MNPLRPLAIPAYRFLFAAMVLAIFALLVLIGVGGATLANNNQSPDIDPATATLNVMDGPATVTSTAPPPTEEETADDARQPRQAEQVEEPAVAEKPPAEPAPAPTPAKP